MNAHKLKATINDVEYEWSGGFGSVIISIERGLKLGEVRILDDFFLYVWRIEKRWFRKPIIHWCVKNIDAASLQRFKRLIFA